MPPGRGYKKPGRPSKAAKKSGAGLKKPAKSMHNSSHPKKK